MGNAQHFLYSLNSDENKQDDEVTVMQNLRRINKKLDHEHCLDIHNTLDVLISKANEPLSFEVLVQKLLPGVNIMNCMQMRDCLLGHSSHLRVRNFPLDLWYTLASKATVYMEK